MIFNLPNSPSLSYYTRAPDPITGSAQLLLPGRPPYRPESARRRLRSSPTHARGRFPSATAAAARSQPPCGVPVAVGSRRSAAAAASLLWFWSTTPTSLLSPSPDPAGAPPPPPLYSAVRPTPATGSSSPTSSHLAAPTAMLSTPR